MRIGIIGLGRIGTMHARNLAQNPNVEQVILIGRDQGRLESAFELVKAALKPGAPVELAGEFPGDRTPAAVGVTTGLEEALPCLDGLVIATTTEAPLISGVEPSTSACRRWSRNRSPWS